MIQFNRYEKIDFIPLTIKEVEEILDKLNDNEDLVLWSLDLYLDEGSLELVPVIDRSILKARTTKSIIGDLPKIMSPGPGATHSCVPNGLFLSLERAEEFRRIYGKPRDQVHQLPNEGFDYSLYYFYR